MNGLPYFWFAVGIGGGVLHGTSLWRAVRRSPEWAAALGLVRLAVLTALLVAAALNRGLVPAALGWAIGFAVVFLTLLCHREP